MNRIQKAKQPDVKTIMSHLLKYYYYYF